MEQHGFYILYFCHILGWSNQGESDGLAQPEETERPLGKAICTWEDNIKIDTYK
jgi:hypothetical protein